MDRNEERKIFININIEKSDDALKFAVIAINENSVITALNRIYYAVFYTVSALAIKNDFRTAKHSALIGWFNKKFINEERVFDTKLLKIYRDIFD